MSAKSDDTFQLNLEAVFESISESIIVADVKGTIVLFNKTAEVSCLDVIKKNLEVGESVYNYLELENVDDFKDKFQKVINGETVQYYYPYSHEIKGTIWAQVFMNPVNKEGVRGVSIAIRDVTAFKSVEEKYRVVFDSNLMPMLVVNFPQKNAINVNSAFISKFGYTPEDFEGMTVKQLQALDVNHHFLEIKSILASQKNFKGERLIKNKEGKDLTCEIVANETRFYGSSIYIVSFNDITERRAAEDAKKKIEEQLLFNNRQLDIIFNTVSDIIFMLSVESTGQYKFISVNNSFLQATGLSEAQIIGKYAHEVIPPTSWTEVGLHYEKAVQTKSAVMWEETSEYPSGVKTGLVTLKPVFDEAGKSIRLVGSVHDITAIKEHEIAINNLNTNLKKRAEELAMSNEELERFAYVTSHDLQEPLRMVTSFLQLLKQRYNHQLDETADRYINFAVEGSQRMKNLILDLLEFSRISSVNQPFYLVDLNSVVKNTIQSFNTVLEESGAQINVCQLPEVPGNESQLSQLFQNLIGNALKYRSELTPAIAISFVEGEDDWQFCVSDNGIGIDEKYAEKIFIIFQRLHNKTEYSGTGIGLAICKKIVEMHGGKIWVSSLPGKGSGFYFTISKLPALQKKISGSSPEGSIAV